MRGRARKSDFDWKAEIVKLVLVKQALAEADRHKLWPWHLPSVAASDEQIEACERKLGFPLDPIYAQFLRHANGWRGFYQAVDLFGTEELCGNERLQRAREVLGYLEASVLQQSRVARDELLPIAVSRFDLDLSSYPQAPVVHAIKREGAVLTVIKKP